MRIICNIYESVNGYPESVPTVGFEPTTSGFSNQRLCQIGLHRRMAKWCPASDSNREPPASEADASAKIGLAGHWWGWKESNLPGTEYDGFTVRPVSITVYIPASKK